ncbi:unnamed protein product [Paramecium octaurelia]|uniref:Uncharacterized protein n=1 Tax=Paramecium octaurelia TaxID=43137 RepID=A0A8S1YAA9_PAROT|nr:unnamed protein product [Paramecium octaurelia]
MISAFQNFHLPIISVLKIDQMSFVQLSTSKLCLDCRNTQLSVNKLFFFKKTNSKVKKFQVVKKHPSTQILYSQQNLHQV